MSAVPFRLSRMLLLLAAPTGLIRAQGLMGTVRDSSTGLGLPGVEILAAGGAASTTDSTGRYYLALSQRGLLVITARRIGYQPRSRRYFFSGDTLRVDWLLVPAPPPPLPQSLPELITTAPGGAGDPRMSGFAERRAGGSGHFIGPEVLRGSEHRQLSDVLRAKVPGIILAQCGGRTTLLTGRAYCPMAVWVDGNRLYTPDLSAGGAMTRRPLPCGPVESRGSPFRPEPPDLNRWTVVELEAIEVYLGPASTPSRFQATGSACGTIVIWTRSR